MQESSILCCLPLHSTLGRCSSAAYPSRILEHEPLIIEEGTDQSNAHSASHCCCRIHHQHQKCVCVSVTKFEYFFTNWASSVDTQMASSNCFDQIEEEQSLNFVKTDPGSLGPDKKQESEKRD